MKKKLLHRVLLLFVSGAMLAGVSGCKDYDDDIDNINNRLDELTTGKIASIESQLGSLQTTVTSLESLSEQVAAISGKLDGLATDSDVQTAIDNALAELKEQLGDTYVTEDLLNTTLLGYATTQSVGDIAGRVSDLESEIGKLASSEDLADQLTKIRGEIETAKNAAVKAAGEACKAAFQTSFDAAVAKAGLVDATEMQDAIDAYDAKIKKYIADAVANGGLINQQIASQINAAVAELGSKISGRLTSVQLIPELYVDGIETIELKSLAYKAWKVTSTDKEETVAQGTAVSTTAQSATAVRYLVSPSVITVDDIKAPSYVFEKAETRAAVSTELMSVEGYEVANGVLTVDVKKTAGASLDLDANHIYTAALKVPIADKHLTEGENSAAVYSDYVRITETTVEPVIAALVDKGAGKPNDGEWECAEDGNHYHFSATFSAAQGAAAVKEFAYNGKVDLLSLVTGCYVDAKGVAHEITKDDLSASGLEFRFSIPALSYKLGDNDTDQQQFAAVAQGEDGSWTLSSKLPGGVTDNQAAIDKTPIVRVELVDVNNANAVVDVRYFKVKWVREALDAVDLGVLKTFDYTLSCEIFSGDVLWSEMVDLVLGKLGENGMSQNEFLATYAAPEIEADKEDHTVGTVATAEADGVELVYNFDDGVDESAAAFIWNLTTEQIGTVMNIRGEQTVKTKTVNVTIPAKNPYQGAISFSFVVNIKLPVLPAIYGYDHSFWYKPGELANVYPIQYNPAMDDTVTCEYNYELNRIFSDSKIVKNLLPCGKWDVQFALKQPTAGYAPAMIAEPAGNGDNSGYLLNKGLETAVKLNYYDMASGNWYAPETGNEGAVNAAPASDIRVWVENNEAGIGILKNYATLKVWSAVNPYNLYQVTEFNVYFKEPLKINRQLKDANFVDQVVSGSIIDCSKAFTMTDFKDYIVAKVTTNTTDEKQKYAADLYKYYGVTNVHWELEEAVVNLKKVNGDYVVDDSMTVEDVEEAKKNGSAIYVENRFGDESLIHPDGDMTKIAFYNKDGVKVEKTLKLFIPVTVSHKWGEVSETVTVELLPEE